MYYVAFDVMSEHECNNWKIGTRPWARGIQSFKRGIQNRSCYWIRAAWLKLSRPALQHMKSLMHLSWQSGSLVPQARRCRPDRSSTCAYLVSCTGGITRIKITMGLDLQLGKLIAGLAGHLPAASSTKRTLLCPLASCNKQKMWLSADQGAVYSWACIHAGSIA